MVEVLVRQRKYFSFLRKHKRGVCLIHYFIKLISLWVRIGLTLLDSNQSMSSHSWPRSCEMLASSRYCSYLARRCGEESRMDSPSSKNGVGGASKGGLVEGRLRC